ncbi:hypothetical protein KFK09_004263 [Dendrobium nobile]|uniref:PGG domain-containing protein n=1 Tax=Dendrobium nobile TaxID=94219 RepID=A0A8T3C2A8_DENNO|nr:hypothetical protein KFK09_004263 [Dendrobium nobile]
MEPTKLEGGNFNSKVLFKKAMAGDWFAVVEMYRKNPLARRAKVTRAKHTILHLAVSEEDDNVVKQLLDAMTDDEARDILSLQNEFGDTPLHAAAALGLAGICWLLAEKCNELVLRSRNNARETPLYIAAHHGKKKAFFVLQDYVPETLLSRQNYNISFCRRGDGNTILHAAVHGEHFDLAIEIMKLYPKLVNFNNEMGQSPLHLLANKPLVFKSGSRLRRIDKLIYACIIVDRLEPKYRPRIYTSHLNGWKKEKEIKMPQNYTACMDLFQALRQVYHLVVSCFGERSIKNCYTANGRQSLRDNNQDAQHGSSSKDLERDEEYGNHEQPKKHRFPENYITAFNFLKIVIKVLLVLLGIGIRRIESIKRKKKRHEQASQVMKELVSQASNWEYEEDGKMPNKDLKEDESTIDTNMPPDEESSAITSESSKGIILHSNSLKKDEDKKADEPIGDTPILIATRRGVVEMVKNILDTFPVAVEDFDSNHKNVVLLSVEHRQPQVYKEMLERKSMRESVFAMVDKDGNSALHLAAGSVGKSRPWVIPGTALQMQWEIKWYKFVKNSMEPSFFQHYNNKGQTAKEIFTASHESLVKEGGKWLTNTSQSCSVVAALIATVAFASATTVPGGVDQTSGFPILAGKPAFAVFAISALVALCFSVTSLIMFLSVLTSRYQEMDFERDLPVKLILGLTTLFMSIAAMLVAFCAGHFFVMEDRLKYGAFPIYIATCLPVTFFVASQFPLYVDLVSAIIADVPERTYKSLTL